MSGEYSPYENDESDLDGINISPLIDVIFILLLFFVVTSVFIEESGVVVDKPDSKSSDSLDDESVVVVVTAGHEIYVGDQKVDLRVLARFLARSKGKSAVIRADGAVRTEFLVKVMDEVKEAGVGEIALATERVER